MGVFQAFSGVSHIQCTIICSLQQSCKAVNIVTNGGNTECQLTTALYYENVVSTISYSQCKSCCVCTFVS